MGKYYKLTIWYKSGSLVSETWDKIENPWHMRDALERVSSGIFRQFRNGIYTLNGAKRSRVIDLRHVYSIEWEPEPINKQKVT